MSELAAMVIWLGCVIIVTAAMICDRLNMIIDRLPKPPDKKP